MPPNLSDTDNSTIHSLGTITAYEDCGWKLCCCISDNTGRCVRCLGTASQRQKTVGVKWVHPLAMVISYFCYDARKILILRLLFFAYSGVVLIFDYLSNFEGNFWFAYLSNLGYITLCLYFLLSSILSACFNYHLDGNKLRQYRDRKATPLELVISILYSTQLAIHMVIPAVYWIDLFYGSGGSLDWFLSKPAIRIWTTISKHGGDLLLMVIELYMNRMIVIWGHFVFMFISMLLYIGWVYLASRIWPDAGPNANGLPYSFLSVDSANIPKTVLSFIGLFLVFVLAYMAGFCMTYVRTVLGKMYQKRFIRSQPKVAPMSMSESHEISMAPL